MIVEGIDQFKIDYPKYVKDSTDAEIVVTTILDELYNLSYLSASFTKTKTFNDSLVYTFLPGKPIELTRLRNGNLSEEELAAIDFNSKLYLNKPFKTKQVNSLFEKVITYFENRGYPFAAVQLDSLTFTSDNSIEAALFIQKNKKYTVDSILIRGNSGINKAFLEQYINIKAGELYNEFKIGQIQTRLREIPFVNQTKKPEIQFFENEVKVLLFLEKKNASRFNGILGLLTNEDDGKIELTGDVDLSLINAFNRGENLSFNWRKLQGNSQDLTLDFEMPYLFKTQFGVLLNFDLFKRDTTFLDLTSKVGISYLLDRGEQVNLFIQNKSSTLLSRNSIVATSTLGAPSLGDVSTSSFGVGYFSNKTDYIYNPTKGLETNINFLAGRKKLRKISALEELNPNIYNDIKLNTNQYEAYVLLNYYIRLNSRNTLKLGSNTALINSENIYTNELLRIGGLKTLRGFDEESINASTYTISTIEYRFLLDRNSYFSLFYDKAFYENNNVDSYSKDDPYGIGAGISFETNAGIFTFNYAVGQQLDNPIQIRAAKIHFGFVNFF